MASSKFGFVTVNPSSGQGSTALSVTGDVYTGRISRSKTIQVRGDGVAVTPQATVNQAAKAEFVTADSPTHALAKTGGSITLTGKSNSRKLSFSLTKDTTNPLNLVLPASYMAAGVNTNLGVLIAGDPGGSGQFVWSITFPNVPANATINELITTLNITADGGQKTTVVITQAEGDPFLTIDKTTINLDANGTAQTLNVTTNTSFTVEDAVSRAMIMAIREELGR